MKKLFNNKITIAAMSVLTAVSTVSAEETPRLALKSNGQVIYNLLPGTADSFKKMFTEGMFYGRVRSNNFLYEWETDNDTQNTHFIGALGGSFIYKTATYGGFDFTGGLYYSYAFFDAAHDPVGDLKAGHDLVSRFDYTNTGNRSMGVLGQAYVRYSGIPKTKLLLGRQLVETFYTKSNDTKMIPNTFDGIVVDTRAIPDTGVKLGYLFRQKLRDHTQAHGVLVYGDANSTTADKPQWSENDDSAMHKGLTYTRLRAAGVSTDAPLIVGDVKNVSVKNLRLDASFYAVPELVSEVMGEVHYKIPVGAFSLTPGVRYIKQFDDGAGKIGGAAYNGKLAGAAGESGGYKQADSLESQMIAARLVGAYEGYKFNLGYTQVMDEADLIAPWRGFPTAGYTRSMARYNWMANTKSYRAELIREGGSNGVYDDLFVQISFLHTDADESKGYYDENYYYAGFIHNIPSMTELQWRLRLGYADMKKADADNLDGRFEVNYLF